jgi:hypothetical protein
MSNTADDVQVAAGAMILPLVWGAAKAGRWGYRKAQNAGMAYQNRRYGAAGSGTGTAAATTTAAPAAKWGKSGEATHTETTSYYHTETTTGRWGKPSK